jgi:hypothetical protein
MRLSALALEGADLLSVPIPEQALAARIRKSSTLL